ncbi:MAG TPA: crosslink repair DNA glycosylase YcaQ family protein [Actinomycetota bacterium]|nr:crosslink repair DNA glycosylase YcaQ family protein [Actinomycetota bacterium]
MALREVSLDEVRRLAIRAQRLDRAVAPSRETILDLVRDLGCVQIDPISVVAPTQHLVLWSRLGAFDRADLDALLWEDRSLFHYWAHAASIVPTSDYPIHHLMMRRWGKGTAKYEERVREWMRVNQSMRRKVVSEIRRRGPLCISDLRDITGERWKSSGWTDEQGVARMIEFLWAKGVVTIAGRAGAARLWDLMDRWLPEWTPRETWPERRVVEESVLRSLRSLGVATPRQIKEHFTRYRYPGLSDALARLVRRGLVEEVAVVGGGERLKGRWYVRAEDAALLDGSLEEASFCRLLSPFDNLICDRARTELVWGFEYRIEIYVPKDKRRWGYYVLPILWGDRLVGRIDSAVDRGAGVLRVLSVHSEPRAPAIGDEVAGAVRDLAGFVGASAVEWPRAKPRIWGKSLT